LMFRSILFLLVLGCSGPRLLGGWSPGRGWHVVRSESFSGKELFSYIDGGAEVFLRCGFRRLEVREYEGPRGTVSVEVYDMGGPEGAKCIFGTYGSGGRRLELGEEGSWAEGWASFRKGRFFVRVLGEGKVPVEVARSLSRKLP